MADPVPEVPDAALDAAPDPAALALPPAHSWLSEQDRLAHYAVERTTALGLKLRCVDVGERAAYNGTAVDLPDGRQLILYRGGGSWPGTRLRYVLLSPDGQAPAPFDAGLAGKHEDPRAIHHDGQLLITTAYYDGNSVRMELWQAHGPDAAGRLALTSRGRFDTVHDWPDYVKPRFEKNWAPFSHDGRLYYVYAGRPHRILEVDLAAGLVRLAYETPGEALRCHGLADPDDDIRMNAPPVRLSDGRYLSTYHVGRHVGERFDYYTGFYTFAGSPPFRPLASTPALLLPEDAEGFIPHDRRPTRCVFITGMTVDEPADTITLWGGDTDRRVITARVGLRQVLAQLRGG